MPMRHLPPAGAPISAPDLVRAVGFLASRRDLSWELRRVFCDRLHVRHSFLAGTGRAGLTILLRALRRLAPPERDEVILPAYTCYSVAASVIKAGLKPRLVDIVPETLDYDEAQLCRTDFRHALAVIATNLYGLPNNLPRLRQITKDRGAFLIDDAAQSMGASIGGRLSGTWGDAGLYSLDKGKNVSAIDGGVVVTQRDDVASTLEGMMRDLPSPRTSAALVDAVKAVAYSVMLRPRLYWIPNGIPQLGLGKTVFTTDYDLVRPSRPLLALGLAVVDHLDAYTRVRRQNATDLLGRLRAISRVQTITAPPDASPVYLRLPILLPDDATKRLALEVLAGRGIGASGSYPASLADVPELTGLLGCMASPAGARDVARRIITLPTHSLVTVADVTRTADAVAEVMSRTERHAPRSAAVRMGQVQ
jgi:perosamine synthetase